MNPNLRIENDYMNNLLKQIHFMNLEIQLMKEKNEENKNVMGLRGIVSQDTGPITEHLITAQNKYISMREELLKKINVRLQIMHH